MCGSSCFCSTSGPEDLRSSQRWRHASLRPAFVVLGSKLICSSRDVKSDLFGDELSVIQESAAPIQPVGTPAALHEAPLLGALRAISLLYVRRSIYATVFYSPISIRLCILSPSKNACFMKMDFCVCLKRAWHTVVEYWLDERLFYWGCLCVVPLEIPKQNTFEHTELEPEREAKARATALRFLVMWSSGAVAGIMRSWGSPGKQLNMSVWG